MEFAARSPAVDRDDVRGIRLEEIGQRVELFLPMRDAVARPQPIDLAPSVLTGRKPMAGERFRLSFAKLGMASSASAMR